MPQSIRKAAVAGSFYPAKCQEIEVYFQQFNREFNRINISKALDSIKPRAIIVPHAGYIYSGFTANFAYRFLNHSAPKRIIVIGPSHHYYFKGISASHFESFQTPCGNIEIDTPYLFALAKEFNIGFVPQAHKKEHSTEVQMPFIQHYFPLAKVIELIYGDFSADKLAIIVTALLRNPDNAVVISSDLSHFYTQKKAEKLDRHCLQAVADLDVQELKSGCEACGFTGIEAMIIAAGKLGLHSKLLDYRTSKESTGDSHSVVGYMSAMFY
ncbi:AmmeMemoRadiSam system protein B [Sulfurovum sp.]|uniref:AmmeMemoRadiSam system protein B n=1 Tax=Sulfurovum sp. TaxID=1969726 RepID=UPI0025D2C304|nr:AmmeMemoRadiSam system protein B [Sulfurovum sp.]